MVSRAPGRDDHGVSWCSTSPGKVYLAKSAPLLATLPSLIILSLDLSDNNFFGPLALLGGLQQLQNLYLNSNNLSGIIPDALTNCSNLTALDISSNSLVGSISPKFGLLSNLVSVSLADNQLEGSC